MNTKRTPLSLAAAAALALLGGAAAAQGSAADEGQTIVVSATRHAMALIDAPAAMSVITRQEIEQRGADNLLDAMRGEIGLSLQGRTIGGRRVVSLRGMDSKHTLFLVDGRRVGASDGVVGHSDFQYDWIAVDDIERIEVVRGPLSVLYGSEALGGVVNVITRRADEHWRVGALAEGSRAEGGRGGDGWRIGASVAGPLAPGLTLRAGAAQSQRDAVATAADPRLTEIESRDKRDAWVALGWTPARGHRIDAELRAGDEERWMGSRETRAPLRYYDSTNFVERRHGAIGWEADWGGVRGLATQLRAYRSTLDVENLRTSGVTPNPTQRLVDAVAEGQARAAFGAHALTGGFETRDETLEDPGLPGGSSTARHRALYLQDEWSFARALDLTLGLRHDDHSIYGSEWSPRAYLVWRVAPNVSLKGGISHGFKAPNLKQIVPGDRREGPNLFRGNPALRPEVNDAVELGIGWSEGGRSAQAVLFDNRIDDLIVVQLMPGGKVTGGPYTYDNLSHARLRGLELGWTEPLAPGWRAQLAYTYLDARGDGDKRLDRRPRHAATLRLDWQGGPWRAGVRVEYSGSQLMPSAVTGQPAQPVPDLTQVGAHLVRALPAGLELTFGVDNLTDVRLSEKSALFGYVELPRTWRLSLRGRW